MKLVRGGRPGGPHVFVSTSAAHAFRHLRAFLAGATPWLGYGMSLASSAGVGADVRARPGRVMGDGGFWQQRPALGVASNLDEPRRRGADHHEKTASLGDGTQELLSSPPEEVRATGRGQERDLTPTRPSENALKGLGVSASHRAQLNPRFADM